MKHKDGYILKSVEGGSKGKNEVKFYEDLQKNEYLAELKKLVPSYYGTITMKVNSNGMLSWNIDFLKQYFLKSF